MKIALILYNKHYIDNGEHQKEYIVEDLEGLMRGVLNHVYLGHIFMIRKYCEDNHNPEREREREIIKTIDEMVSNLKKWHIPFTMEAIRGLYHVYVLNSNYHSLYRIENLEAKMGEIIKNMYIKIGIDSSWFQDVHMVSSIVKLECNNCKQNQTCEIVNTEHVWRCDIIKKCIMGVNKKTN